MLSEDVTIPPKTLEVILHAIVDQRALLKESRNASPTDHIKEITELQIEISDISRDLMDLLIRVDLMRARLTREELYP